MNLTNAPSKIVLPFANGGGKNTIPVASQIGLTDGAASWTDGFPPLTRTPKAAGGVPPAGLDMNGVLNATSAICRWTVTGAGYTYDSTFAADANIGGYPKAARVARTDGAGYWINTTDGNTTDPEAGGAGWYPDFTAGATSITMTSSNVTLTPLQYGKQVIIITGTLTANVNLIFPALVAKWTVINNTTGNYTITCKTASGAGIPVVGVQAIVGVGTNIQLVSSNSTQIQSVSASVGSNALTASYAGDVLDFRNETLATGSPSRVKVNALSITVPSGATLGTTSAVASRLVLLVAYNAGSPVLCVANLSGGMQLDETNLVSPTTISAGAISAGVIYSASAVSANSPYRVVGFIDITQATAGTWATAPTLVQGVGGQALTALSALGYGQTYQDVSASRSLGTTYYNTTGRPIYVTVRISSTSRCEPQLIVNGVSFFGTAGEPGLYLNVAGIIPPGGAYSATVTAGAPTKLGWVELR